MTGRRGCFITLEGGEGTGKSTQARRLAAHLRGRGLDVVETREPGGSPGAEAVRRVLLSGLAEPLGPKGEALLFAAARADHVDHLIAPALDAGKVVICDRFIDSTRVYQGLVGRVERPLLDALEQLVAAEARPDLTLVLDVPPEIGLARAAARDQGQPADRFERQGPDYHRAVREAYLAIAHGEPERCVVVDASAAPEQVAEQVAALVDGRLAHCLGVLRPAAAPGAGSGALP